MHTSQHISLAERTEGEARGMWGDFISAMMGRTVDRVEAPGELMAEGTAQQLAGLQLCRLVSSPHEVSCGQGLGRPFAHAVAAQWQVCLQLEGQTLIEQCGRSHRLVPGDWSLNFETGSYRVSHAETTKQLVLIIPRDRMPPDLYALAPLAYGARSSAQGAARMFSNLLKDGELELPRTDVTSHEALEQTMLSLLRAALLERAAEVGAARSTDLLYDRAMAYLRTHFSDPDLSLAEMARALGCSKRYLHQVFNNTGSAPAQTLLRLRLEHCRAALRQVHQRHLPVATIALSAGFRDAAHFGRLFRQHYGLTPGTWRGQNSAE